jgi:hypothetical protein
MLRTALFSVAALVLWVGLLPADDKNAKDATKNDKKHEATITKVDAKNGTITVRMKDKNGKDEERTFKLTEDLRMWDNEGHAATIDVFRSGHEVVVVEREGKLVEMKRHDKNKSSTDKENASAEKKPGGGK